VQVWHQMTNCLGKQMLHRTLTRVYRFTPCTIAGDGHHMEKEIQHSTHVPPAWHGAALRRALLPLNGLRTISTVAVMVRDYYYTFSRHWKSGLLWLRV
jgi:hypothetical protein